MNLHKIAFTTVFLLKREIWLLSGDQEEVDDASLALDILVVPIK